MRLKLDVVTIEGGRRVARSFPLEVPEDAAIQGIRIYGPEGLIYSDLYAYPDEDEPDRPAGLAGPPADWLARLARATGMFDPDEVKPAPPRPDEA